MMYSERIFVSKMKSYLHNIILKYNTSSYADFLNFTQISLKQTGRNNQEIIKILYFEKFYPILKKNEVIAFTKNQMDPNFISAFENEVLSLITANGIQNNINLYQHLKSFGNFRINLLDEISKKYETLDNQSFLMISKIFMVNDYKNTSWELKCIERIPHILKSNDKIDSLTFKLLEHLSKFSHNRGNKFFQLDQLIKEQNVLIISEEIEPTKTQKSLEVHFNQMNIKYKVEFSRDYYRYDYFLPEKNIVIEYDGPDHFYPLQTQLSENSKFKYKNINEKFGSRLVIIPHFEYSRYDSPDLAFFFLKKIIFNNYDISNTPLFHENYNYFKPLRNKID